MPQPEGLTFVDADEGEPVAIAANEWRVWATDNATGQRMSFDWELQTERGLDWKVDVDDARYVAARKAAILRLRGRS